MVALGLYQGGASGLILGDEFHHNRINLVCSQIGGIAAELQNRWNQIRLVHTFMNLQAQKKVQMHPLITHTGSAWEAQQFYELIDSHPDEVIQSVRDFRQEPPANLDIKSL